MKIDKSEFLKRALRRDRMLMMVFSAAITFIYLVTVFERMPWESPKIIIGILILAEFYLISYLTIPLQRRVWRVSLEMAFYAFNFFLLRAILVEFAPAYVSYSSNFELLLIVLYVLMLLGRGMRMQATLSTQLENLEKWSRKKILFEKPEKLRLTLGEAGEQDLHPNEILYIRTRAAGDHTKIFGIKSRISGKFQEYETTVYRNFDEIGRKLMRFPQFKRINRGTVINQIYPFEERGGVVIIEGRRFSVRHTH